MRRDGGLDRLQELQPLLHGEVGSLTRASGDHHGPDSPGREVGSMLGRRFVVDVAVLVEEGDECCRDAGEHRFRVHGTSSWFCVDSGWARSTGSRPRRRRVSKPVGDPRADAATSDPAPTDRRSVAAPIPLEAPVATATPLTWCLGPRPSPHRSAPGPAVRRAARDLLRPLDLLDDLGNGLPGPPGGLEEGQREEPDHDPPLVPLDEVQEGLDLVLEAASRPPTARSA